MSDSKKEEATAEATLAPAAKKKTASTKKSTKSTAKSKKVEPAPAVDEVEQVAPAKKPEAPVTRVRNRRRG